MLAASGRQGRALVFLSWKEARGSRRPTVGFTSYQEKECGPLMAELSPPGKSGKGMFSHSLVPPSVTVPGPAQG